MKYKVSIADGLELLVECDKEAIAVREAKRVKDAIMKAIADKKVKDANFNKSEIDKILRGDGFVEAEGEFDSGDYQWVGNELLFSSQSGARRAEGLIPQNSIDRTFGRSIYLK